jgi:hypothetical protein
MNLVKRVPNTMQQVSDYEHSWQSNTKQPEDSEDNHAADFKLPRSVLPEVGGKR